MWQELIRIPLPFDLPLVGDRLVIYGFGLMLVVGFLLAMELARRLARQRGIDPEVFSNAALLALLTGILGARLSHVLENLSEYTRADRSLWANLVAAANISSGGLTYYGGFLLAFPTLLLYGRAKRIHLPTGMDVVAPCLMVGLAFGRLGCFLNGCCFGAACALPWAVAFPYASPPYVDQFEAGKINPPPQLVRVDARGERSLRELAELRQAENGARLAIAETQRSLPLHPAQLYSAFTASLLAGLLVTHFRLPHAPGRTFALMLMLEAAARFSLELVRSEPPVLWGMSFSMAVSIPLVLLGALLWAIFGKLATARRGAADELIASGAARAAG